MKYRAVSDYDGPNHPEPIVQGSIYDLRGTEPVVLAGVVVPVKEDAPPKGKGKKNGEGEA